MLEVTLVGIEKLKPNDRNARTHARKQVQQIADSITAFGFVNPILVDEEGRIIAGHGRHAALLLLGRKEVPVIVLRGLSKAKRRALAIADNKIAANAGWNRELLALELPELAEVLIEEKLEISITGFAAVEIDQLAADFEERAADAADEVDPRLLTADPVSKPGDLWQLGHHRLLWWRRTRLQRARALDGRMQGRHELFGSAVQFTSSRHRWTWRGPACGVRDGVWGTLATPVRRVLASCAVGGGRRFEKRRHSLCLHGLAALG